MERADGVSFLRERGAQRYVNTYVDRQVGQSIATLGLRDMIGRVFYGPIPSTDISTVRPLNFVIAVGMWRDFQTAWQVFIFFLTKSPFK